MGSGLGRIYDMDRMPDTGYDDLGVIVIIEQNGVDVMDEAAFSAQLASSDTPESLQFDQMGFDLNAP